MSADAGANWWTLSTSIDPSSALTNGFQATAVQVATLHQLSDPNPWTVSQWQSALSSAHGQFFGLFNREINQELIALAYFQVMFEQAELFQIFVKPEYRKRGLAKNLLTRSIKKIHDFGVKSVFIEVAEDNQDAIVLYEQSRFVKFGRRKGYYTRKMGKSIDALLMRFDYS